jgi:hypothetical protein
MTMPETRDDDVAEVEITLGDLLQPVLKYRAYILFATVLITAVAALAAGILYARQGATRGAVLSFRVIFPGAAFGLYPNGQPFAPSDVVTSEIVEAVVARNRIETYCSTDAFRSGLVVVESSPELAFLNAAFEAHLADPRLTALERQQFADEYASRRASTPTQFDLRYLDPAACARIPDAVLVKALPDVVETWAAKTEDVAGALRFDTPVLTPAVLDDQTLNADLIVRADLLRTGLGRVIANIQQTELLPGAGQFRGSDAHVSLSEVRAGLEDLRQARLDPLIAEIGRGPEGRLWMEQTLKSARAEETAAQRRADVYYAALREYSRGVVPSAPDTKVVAKAAPTLDAVPLASTVKPDAAKGLTTPTAQVDRTLVERIVELSAPSVAFRQDLTRKAIDASVEAVNRGALVAHYESLLAAPGRAGDGPVTSAASAAALGDIRSAAKALTARYNDIYTEFARVSLREGAALYRVEGPVTITPVQTLTVRHLAAVVVGTMVATPIVLALGLLFRFHASGWVSTWRRASLRK